MAEVAPYLVKLQKGHKFTEWLIDNYVGKHWGIFAISSASMVDVRKHFRTFLMVQGPDGKSVYFRYYDPRVLRLYLPTCNAEETSQVFGPIDSFWLEDESQHKVLSFSVAASLPEKSEFVFE